MKPEPLLRLDEVCAILRVSRWTVQRLVDAGALERVELARGGNRYRSADVRRVAKGRSLDPGSGGAS